MQQILLKISSLGSEGWIFRYVEMQSIRLIEIKLIDLVNCLYLYVDEISYQTLLNVLDFLTIFFLLALTQLHTYISIRTILLALYASSY